MGPESTDNGWICFQLWKQTIKLHSVKMSSFLFLCQYTLHVYHFKKLHSSDILPLVSCSIKLMISSISVTGVAWSDFWVTIPFNFKRLQHYHYQSNRNQMLVMCYRKMKVSNGVHSTKIWVTIATKWCHAPFYIKLNNLPPDIILGIWRRDLSFDIVNSTMAK